MNAFLQETETSPSLSGQTILVFAIWCQKLHTLPFKLWSFLSFTPIPFSPQELLNIIASVLHLGNVQYGGEDSGSAFITTETQIKYLARVIEQFIYTTVFINLSVCVQTSNRVYWNYMAGFCVWLFACVFVILQLLGVDGTVLKEALTHKKIIAKGEEVCFLII